jgi:hypothetical protein
MMKRLLAFGVVCAIGLGVGFAVGWHYRTHDPALAIQSQMRESISSQKYATAISLAVLLRLERGDVESAKAQLARQAATYEHSWARYDRVLPEHGEILPLIRDAAADSPVLRQELAKKLQ